MSEEPRALCCRSAPEDDSQNDQNDEEAGPAESQNSSSSFPQAHTGLSLDMENALLIEEVDGVEHTVVVPSVSIGTVCVVHREARGRMKEVKKFALPNTFYAYPKDATDEMKEKIASKMQVVVDNFSLQNYETTIMRFGLPFAVAEVCSISCGYNMTPKRMMAVAAASTNTKGKKRKPVSSSDSSESSESESSDADDVIEEKEEATERSTRAAKRSKQARH